MIPEAYLGFLWRWGWLLVILFILGAGGAFYVTKSLKTFESVIVLEVTHAYRSDGTISFGEFDRRIEAVRLGEELKGPWVGARLRQALTDEGVPAIVRSGYEYSVSLPSRVKERVGPPIITIIVRHPDPASARRVSEVATKVFSEYLRERLNQAQQARVQQAEDQAHMLEDNLRLILIEKGRALGQASEDVSFATQDLLQTHARLLAQLPVLLDDFRRQVGVSNTGLGASTEELDSAIANLRSDLTTVGDAWSTDLRPALQVLYAVEAQPDHQLALIREQPVRAKYGSALVLLTALVSNPYHPSSIEVLQAGSGPRPTPLLGLRRSYAVGGGGMLGLAIGWMLANIGEHLLSRRSRKKEMALPNSPASVAGA